MSAAVAQLKFVPQPSTETQEKSGLSRLFSLKPGRPHPELAGLKVRTIGETPIYLIDREGYRRQVPFPLAFINLFNDLSALRGVQTTHSTEEIASGPALDERAIMVRGTQSERIYLMDHGKKRLISSPQVMQKYGFDESCVVAVPQVVVEAIPAGEAWE